MIRSAVTEPDRDARNYRTVFFLGTRKPLVPPGLTQPQAVITTALAELHAQRARNRADTLGTRYRIAAPTSRSDAVPDELGAGGRLEESAA